ncbi:MAG: hypothetical protein E2591_21225 [Achromobacter sp.]|jgi:hypothetical protein|uniref:hypothetical protein n=1 Tax=Achromobacter TaxID=222 RepID=UPI000F8F917F|nr:MULTISPECIES: hypothetical protein [Achromobacter]AZS77367.1 hypothetical protein ELS24_02250 [Achromobacter spanius]MPS80599.1 hypothetical protein [Achromobacter sp.]
MNALQRKREFNSKYQFCSQADGSRATNRRWLMALTKNAAAHFVALTILGTAIWHAHSHEVPIVEAFQEAFMAILLDAQLLVALALMSTVAGLRGGKRAIYVRASELSKLSTALI